MRVAVVAVDPGAQHGVPRGVQRGAQGELVTDVVVCGFSWRTRNILCVSRRYQTVTNFLGVGVAWVYDTR